MSHWTKGLSPKEHTVLVAVLTYAVTGRLPRLDAALNDVAVTMTNELDRSCAQKEALGFVRHIAQEDRAAYRALFFAAFKDQADQLRKVFSWAPTAFYADALSVCSHELWQDEINEQIEAAGRAKGWFVQQANDGNWYYKWFHGDPAEEGEFASEAEAWLAASRDDSTLASIPTRRSNPVLQVLETVLSGADAQKALAALAVAGIDVIPNARETIFDVIGSIKDFDRQCEETEYTDVGTVWELLHGYRDKLLPLLSEDQRRNLDSRGSGPSAQLMARQSGCSVP